MQILDVTEWIQEVDILSKNRFNWQKEKSIPCYMFNHSKSPKAVAILSLNKIPCCIRYPKFYVVVGPKKAQNSQKKNQKLSFEFFWRVNFDNI